MAEETIADFVDIVMGQSPPGNTVSRDVGIPLLNGPTEFGPHHPSPVQFTTDARKIANPRDLLFCVRGSTTGRMNWADQKYAIGRGIAAFRHRRLIELQPFVRAVIEFQLPELLAQATGSTFPNVSASQLAAIRYPNFSEAAQHAIAHILGTLDDKIELNRQMNETLEATARAIFKSWFVDFDPVRAKIDGREANLSPEVCELFPNRFVHSEMGEIPNGWSIGTLSDLSHKPQYGYTASAKDEPVGPKFLRITDINKKAWIDWDAVPYCEITDNDYKKYHLEKGDVLIARMADPGHGVMVEENQEAVFASYLIRYRPIREQYARFLQYWLRSSNYWNLVKERETGTTRASLNAKVLSGFPLVIPSPYIVETFSNQVSVLRDRVVANALEIQLLTTLRDTLLPKLLSGELRLV